jgi:hypothetical protein
MFANMSVKDFINYIVKFDNVSSIISKCENQADIRKLKIKKISESEFYKLIGLTNNEIELFSNKTN